MDVFREELGELWPAVAPRCEPLGTDDVADLSVALEIHLHEHPVCAERVGELANDLMALMAGWAHYGEEQRAVLVGAMRYLTDADDVVPDEQPGGLDDDDRVVGAAVRAVLRSRRRAA